MRPTGEMNLDMLAVLNESPAVTYVTDVGPDPFISFVSDSVRHVLGFSPEQLVENPGFFTSLVHPDDRPGIIPTLLRAQKEGAATVERRLRIASGEWRWFRDIYRITPARGDKPGYGVGAIIDITEERAARLREQRQAAEFRMLTEHSSDLITRISLDGLLIYQSPSVIRSLGYPTGLELGGYAWSRIHEDDLPALMAAWRVCLKTREPRSCGYRIRHADGRWVTLEAVLNPAIDESGRVIEFVVVSRDISERLEAERRLAEADQKIRAQGEVYDLFARHGSDIFLRFDTEGNALHVSPSAARILGEGMLERDGRLLHLVHPDDRPAAEASFRRAHQEQAPANYRQRYRRADGGWVWLDIALTPLMSEETGEIVEYIAVARSIDDQVRRDEQLEATRRELEESRAHLRMVTDNMLDVVILTRSNGEIAYMSPSLTKLTGFSLAEYRAQSFESLVHPDDLAMCLVEIARNRQGEASERIRYRVRHKDGRWFWVERRASALRDVEQDGGVAILSTIRDVTTDVEREAHIAETTAELEESRKRLQLVTDNIQDAISLFRPDGSVAYMSPSTARLVGYTPDELSQIPFGTLSHPEDRPRLFDEAIANRRGEVSSSIRYRMRHREGRWIWVERRASAVRDHDFGDGVAVMSVISDVTGKVENEREIAEAWAALQESQAKLKSTIDNSIDVIAVFSADRRIEYISPSCEQQSGYTVDEFVNGRAAFTHPDDESIVVEALMREDAGGPGETFRYRGVRKDGAVVWLDRRARKVFDAQTGALRSIVTVTRDISEVVEHEQRMAAANALLEKSKAAAESASVAKSQFLATMSHELRTPMTGVMGMLDLMKGAGLNPEQARFADIAYESAENLLVILNDILDFSKVEAGQLQLDLAPFALRAELDKVVQLLTPVAQKKGDTLEVSIDEAIPARVVGDAVRVRQVLFNLIGNAIKFTNEGLVKVTLRALVNGRVRVEIQDTGVGIPEDALPKLFRPFVQVDGSSSRKAGGTGLGLAICKSLVEAMGGEIGAVSVDGRGSCFWFETPLPAAAQPAAKPAPALSGSQPEVRRRFDILVAEDHPVNQQLIYALLKRDGHRAIIVPNGREAVNAVQKRRFDLVLMDVQMPVLDGAAATVEIRALEGPASTVPIVAITANALRGDMESYIAAGMNGYVSKPIRIDALREAMEAAVPRAETLDLKAS